MQPSSAKEGRTHLGDMAIAQDLAQSVHQLLGVSLSPAQRESFQAYLTLLIERSRQFNLTAITHPAEIEIKHFLDSLTCLLVMSPQEGDRMVDVGSGAGFPGLPLKILYPEIRLTLIESNRKKSAFIQDVVEQLGLNQVDVVPRRVEQVGQDPDYRESFDWATARAVAKLPVLMEYLLPLLRVGGKAVAQKGDAGPAEAQAAEASLLLLGGSLKQILPVELPSVAESRYVLLIEKVAGTPAKYPRRVGIPAKRPL